MHVENIWESISPCEPSPTIFGHHWIFMNQKLGTPNKAPTQTCGIWRISESQRKKEAWMTYYINHLQIAASQHLSFPVKRVEPLSELKFKSDIQGVSPVFSWFSLLSSPPGVTSKKKLHRLGERCLRCWMRCIEQDVFSQMPGVTCMFHKAVPWRCHIPESLDFKDQTFMSEIPSPKSTEFLGDSRHLAQQQRIGVLKELHPKPQMLLYPMNRNETSRRNIFCSEPWWILEG